MLETGTKRRVVFKKKIMIDPGTEGRVDYISI